jgi:hypothetical protein
MFGFYFAIGSLFITSVLGAAIHLAGRKWEVSFPPRWLGLGMFVAVVFSLTSAVFLPLLAHDLQEQASVLQSKASEVNEKSAALAKSKRYLSEIVAELNVTSPEEINDRLSKWRTDRNRYETQIADLRRQTQTLEKELATMAADDREKHARMALQYQADLQKLDGQLAAARTKTQVFDVIAKEVGGKTPETVQSNFVAVMRDPCSRCQSRGGAAVLPTVFRVPAYEPLPAIGFPPSVPFCAPPFPNCDSLLPSCSGSTPTNPPACDLAALPAVPSRPSSSPTNQSTGFQTVAFSSPVALRPNPDEGWRPARAD